MKEPSSIAAMEPDVVTPGPHDGIGFREFVGLVAAMMATNALAIDTMLPALPQIGSSLGVLDDAGRQWIVTAFLLGFGGAQIVYGPLSDRFGRRPVLLGGLAGYVVCGIGAALAPTFATLIAMRVLQGVCVAATRVVTISVVRDCYAGRQMARVMSLAFMVFLAVPVLAPSLGELIMLVMPWRWLFAVLAIYGGIVLVWLALRMPETLHPSFRRPISFASIGGAMALTLGQRQSLGYLLAQTVITGALFGFINSVQPIFAETFHRPHAMPLVFAGIAGMMSLAALVNSRIVERLGTRLVSHSALIGFLLAEAVHLVIATRGGETIASFAICQGIAMFCFGLTSSNFNAMAMEPLAAVAGTGAAVQGCISTIGGALAGFAIGRSFDGTTVPMTLGFAAAGAVALGIVFVTERGRLFRPRLAE